MQVYPITYSINFNFSKKKKNVPYNMAPEKNPKCRITTSSINSINEDMLEKGKHAGHYQVGFS